MKLNLGAGKDKKDGYVNIDNCGATEPDFYHDLEAGLPFPDNSVSEIIAKDIIEHLSNPIKMFNEMWRVCENDATIYIEMPSALCPAAYDFSHKTFMTMRQFRYITETPHLEPNYLGLHCNFKSERLEIFDCSPNADKEHMKIVAVLKVIK